MRSLWPFLATTLACSSVAAAGVSPQESQDGQRVSFFDSIKPLFSVHCYKCHGPEKSKGGLRLDLRDRALAAGDSGTPAIIPGASTRSELMRRVTSRDPEERMPPQGPPLTETEITRLQRWVDEGAFWPERDDYWAFRPPVGAPVPDGAAAHPIDRFLDARLALAKLAPVPPADARTLLRRAFFDLLGEPPSPEEAARFLPDPAPDAYEQLVDRLLADPRYGERWARHWLDLVRYGESDGYEDDKVRPHAWRYRDYVVRSLNADKPYDRFVQEQIAGDELWPQETDAWIATGFARLGAWDGMAKEPAQQRQDFLNDATDAVGAVFLGVTLGCARCHDHKYDVITQRDYYRMQAFFASVKRDVREPESTLPEPAGVTREFRSTHADAARLRRERDDLLSQARQVLEQEQAASAEAQKPSKIPDDMVKKRVEKDHPGRLRQLTESLASLEPRERLLSPKIESVWRPENAASKTHVLKGGDLHRPDEEVTPGFIAAMEPPGRAVSADPRGAGLARWLASPENPLVARVLVNRLWQHHFGAGLVATPSDFGRNGKPPTHPELLDWLACRFVQEGWSLKRMHRLIMTSAAYRRAAVPDAACSAGDPENRLLWRMNRRRLEAETIRDTFLVVSSRLNPAMGGPGVYARLPKGVNIEFPNNDKELSWGKASDDDHGRRSLYLFQRRSLTYPLMEVFDAAPMNQSCAARPTTTVAPQALALFNGEFARETAADFAARLRREAGPEPARQVERAFVVAFNRPPSLAERAEALEFLREQGARRASDAAAALVDFCHVLLNANELIYPD
jgi:mono/diheme cytochrome c family protein